MPASRALWRGDTPYSAPSSSISPLDVLFGQLPAKFIEVLAAHRLRRRVLAKPQRLLAVDDVVCELVAGVEGLVAALREAGVVTAVARIDRLGVTITLHRIRRGRISGLQGRRGTKAEDECQGGDGRCANISHGINLPVRVVVSL